MLSTRAGVAIILGGGAIGMVGVIVGSLFGAITLGVVLIFVGGCVICLPLLLGHQRFNPNYERWWSSHRRGVHDNETHFNYCCRDEGCREVWKPKAHR